MSQKLGLSFVVFWLVISAAFGLILIQHVRDIGFKYPVINYADRLSGVESNTKKSIFRNKLVQGPLTIIEETFDDGTKVSSIMVNGTPLDNPTRISVDSVNNHIATLSAKKDEENTTAIVLDAIGLISSLFSAFVANQERKRTLTAAIV